MNKPHVVRIAVLFILSRSPAVFSSLDFFSFWTQLGLCASRNWRSSVLEFYELLNELDTKVCVEK